MSFIDTLKTYCLALFELLKAHGVMLISVSIGSMLISILFCTFVITYLPADYFLPNRRASRISHPFLRGILVFLKNLFAFILVIIGILQLFLPGQGILTMLIGIIISDVPGKRKLERKIIRLPVVLAAANGIRSWFKRPLFTVDEPAE